MNEIGDLLRRQSQGMNHAQDVRITGLFILLLKDLDAVVQSVAPLNRAIQILLDFLSASHKCLLS